jgi:uncharacterized protein (DUF362 family)
LAYSFNEVFILKTLDRASGIPKLLEHFNLNEYSGKQVALKANYNSADPFPASTHLDTLRAVVEALKGAGADKITMGERSGMGDTREVLEERGVFRLAEELGFEAIVLDELDKDGWVKFERDQTHWLRGFYLAKIFHDADKVVQTCCLKTHRYGGHFTLSMKNAVGMVAREHRAACTITCGNCMGRLSATNDSRNQQQLQPRLGSYGRFKAFVTGGPENGDW